MTLKMTSYQVILTGYIFLINGIAYAVMCFDKLQSKRKGNRVSEKYLFLISILFGATGIYAGMKFPVYHKSSKAYFRLGIPLLIALNAAMIYACIFLTGINIR